MATATSTSARPSAATPAQRPAPGPIRLVLGSVMYVIVASIGGWVLGVLVELVGIHTIWKAEGELHSRAMVLENLGYIAEAPKSLVVRDTVGLANRTVAWIEGAYRAAGVLDWYVAMRTPVETGAPEVAGGRPEAKGYLTTLLEPLKRRVKSSSSDVWQSFSWHLSRWLVVSMYVGQDTALRLLTVVFAIPAFVMASLLGAVDGLARRDIRRWGAGRESGDLHHYAKKTTKWFLVAGFAIYLSWPVGGFNPAYMVLIFAAAFAISLSTTIYSYKKYL